jgi:hypothetical protein
MELLLEYKTLINCHMDTEKKGKLEGGGQQIGRRLVLLTTVGVGKN